MPPGGPELNRKALSIDGVPTGEETMLRYGVSATPTFVIIDK